LGITGIVIIIFLVTMTLVILAIVKGKVKGKKIIKIIIITLILTSCFLFGAFQYFQRSSSFIFARSTNLEENINSLRLYDKIDSKEFIKKYGINIKSPDYEGYDYYNLSDGLLIATNKQKQIIAIMNRDTSESTIKTGKGIKLESSVDNIIKFYGPNYYKRMDDTGLSVIGYVDKKRKINLELFYYQNKVKEIRYTINSMQ
jgi:hypothetical protein